MSSFFYIDTSNIVYEYLKRFEKKVLDNKNGLVKTILVNGISYFIIYTFYHIMIIFFVVCNLNHC